MKRIGTFILAMLLLVTVNAQWSTSQLEGKLDHVVTVREASDFGVISSTTQYFLDGIIDMGTTSLEIPAGGMFIGGINFDLSGLTSTENNYTLFTSPTGGSGNVLFMDFHIDISGTNSQVYDIVGNTGFEAIEVDRINFNNCTSLGTIKFYRQGLETGTGRFGGSPNLILDSTWAGGYFIQTSIVRSLDAGVYALYEAGATFSMASRFRSNQNIDLNTNNSFVDFAPSNFVNPSILQLNECIVSRNGVFNTEDALLTPNIDQTDIASSWKDNKGLSNTFIGGTMNITSEAATTITIDGTFVDLAGTFTTSDLVHFDSPSNGQLRHLGDSPREYKVSISAILDCTSNDEVDLKIVVWDDSASGFVDYKTIRRVINALQGGRNVAYFTTNDNIILDTDDYVKIQVANIGATNDITGELDTEMSVEVRN